MIYNLQLCRFIFVEWQPYLDLHIVQDYSKLIYFLTFFSLLRIPSILVTIKIHIFQRKDLDR